MIRPFIGLLGIVTALFPDGIIDVFEAVAIENPEESPIKPWISSGIRGEGLIVTLASLSGGRAYAWMMNLTGIVGAFVLLFPQGYRTFAATLLYQQPGEVEWNDQFAAGVRIIGVMYVLMAVWEYQKRRVIE